MLWGQAHRAGAADPGRRASAPAPSRPSKPGCAQRATEGVSNDASAVVVKIVSSATEGTRLLWNGVCPFRNSGFCPSGSSTSWNSLAADA